MSFLLPPIFPSRKLIFCLMVVILCYLIVWVVHPKCIKTNIGPFMNYILFVMINSVLLMTLEVILVLGPDTYPPIKLVQVQIVMMGGLRNTCVIAYHHAWYHWFLKGYWVHYSGYDSFGFATFGVKGGDFYFQPPLFLKG